MPAQLLTEDPNHVGSHAGAMFSLQCLLRGQSIESPNPSCVAYFDLAIFDPKINRLLRSTFNDKTIVPRKLELWTPVTTSI
jgi:hypothetical protein